MNFSVNQVRHLYVAKRKTASDAPLQNAGDIKVAKTADGKSIYFKYMGAGKNITRSDLIPIDSITCFKHVKAKAMEHGLRKVLVTLSQDTLKNGKPIPGQDYVLRLVLSPFIGMSDEDVYIKYGAVHTYASDTESDFYKKMALSLAKNFSRELAPMLSFSLQTSTDDVPVKANTKAESLTGTYTGLIIEEVDQEWRLGVKEESFINFQVIPATITVNGDDNVTWGEVEDVEPTTVIANGRKIADLEYFCMGERGDQYRQIGWPNNIHTEYLVTPYDGDTVQAYDIIELHYAYTDEGISTYRSEKDIEIAVPTIKVTVPGEIVSAIEAATGLTAEVIPVPETADIEP